MTRLLTGKHAMVTGGGKGIGAACARALALRGASLTLLGRDEKALDALAAELHDTYEVGVTPMMADVTSVPELDGAFGAAAHRLGPISILVNNAGQAASEPLIRTPRALWDRMLAINATSAFDCTQRVLAGMIDNGWGRIINVASTAGLRGVARVAAYSASKHALIGLTRSLALEVAEQGVTVNAVCPGYTDTAIAEQAVHSIAEGTGRSREEALRLITRPSAFGRLLDPAEVAGVVAWLCSPDADAVTGQAIVIGGDVV
jgi:NAD(P)-dependent dehydrogenase (short-subunit alcohol dehydrogenase family)